MKSVILAGVAGLLSAASVANADPLLQFDVNSFNVGTTNSAGLGSAFGGLTHTGSVNFSVIPQVTVLNGMFGNGPGGGPLTNLGFNGSLSNFTGHIDMVNGQITGGSVTLSVNGGTDSYTTDIQNAGHVEAYIGGGFKIEGLMYHGAFTDSQFGNVNVSNWFNQTLVGSFLQFNWLPDENGRGSGDMDIFVDVVPLPAGVWMGLATMGGVAFYRRKARRN